MANEIQMVRIEHRDGEVRSDVRRFGVECARKTQRFHQSFPEYSVTPLVSLKGLAEELGVAGIQVKDESKRFGLNAFKVLGGSYAIGRYIAGELGTDINDMPYPVMTSDEVREKIGVKTFVTATDGNHGRGIAWTANRLKQKSVVYMPYGSARERLENIRALGAQASITDRNYDDAVRLAGEHAKKYGWILVQDTSWEGYEDIPAWIMEGYTTMAYEVLCLQRAQKPTHVFLQAGVGAMSGAVTAFIADLYGDAQRPKIVIVEPDSANCIYQTAKANDGRLRYIRGNMDSIMAGLCCGEPCPLGWKVLRDHADFFVSMPDYIAALGMRILGNPTGEDERIISGESGACTVGFAAAVLRNPEYREIRDQLELDENSRILCFSTEGDTDRENYRRIVWEGAYAGK